MKLELSNINIIKGEQKILNDVTLNLSDASYGILGVSGSGKTTLANLVSRLETEYDGQMINEYKKIGYLSQNRGIFPQLSIKDNVLLGKHKDKKTDSDEVEKLLFKLNMAIPTNKLAGSLSGGEQQRVALARMLFWDFDLIIADEPLTALDTITKKEILDLFINHFKERSVIYITHDVRELEVLNFKTIVMAEGRVIANDTLTKLSKIKDKTIEQLINPYKK